MTTRAERKQLATPEGKALRARIDAATTEFCAVDRDAHIRGITLVVLRAQRKSLNDHRPQLTSAETKAAGGRGE